MNNQFPRIKEATYLSAEKSSVYREILRYFFIQHERMKEFLMPQEVYAHLRLSLYFQDYAIEQMHLDLQILVQWGNLVAQQDSSNARTIEEYKKKRFRYQVTPYTVEFERMLVKFEQTGDTFGGSLERTQFEKLFGALQKMEMVDASPELCASQWDDVLMHFQNIRQSTSDYFAYIRSEDMNERMKSDSFLVYKDQFTAYLRDFILASQKTAAQIEALMRRMTDERLQRYFSKVTAYRDQVFRLEDVSADPMETLMETWQGIRAWFIGGPTGESQFDYLQQETNEQIRRMTRIVQRLGERNRQVRSRKEDYVHLAKWFSSMDDIKEAHRLSAVAFGVFHTRHLHVDHETTDDMYVDVWDEAPMNHEITPRIREYREKTKPTAMADHAAERERAKIEHIERRKSEQALIEQYIQDGKISVSRLPEVEPSVRKMLLSWIGKAMLREDRTIKTELGALIKVNLEREKRTVVVSEDGTLELPEVMIEFTGRKATE